MIAWIDDTGRVARWVLTASVIPEGAIELDDGIDPLAVWIDTTGAVQPLPPQPSETCVFDRATGAWLDPRSAAEVRAALWAELRAERDRRLLACDYYGAADYPHTDASRAAWWAYRRALRDLPEVTTDPERPDWPIPPET